MRNSRLLNLLLLSAVAVGCTDSPVDDSVSNATTTKREVVVGVGNGSKMSVTPEDGYWDIEWEATDQVVGWTELGEKSSFSVNEIYSDGRADIKGTISDMSEKMRFFYPYDAAFDGTIDLSTQTFDFAEEGYNSLGDATLYMLSDEFAIPEEGDVATTTMHHLLSYLKLNITPSNLDDTYVVNKAVIKGLGYNKATLAYDFDFDSPVLTTDQKGDVTLTIENAVALENGETTTIPFTIVPFTTTGDESITVDLYFDDKFVGMSITISEVAADLAFEMGKYNDLNAAFDFDSAESINPTTYALTDFDGSLAPAGDTWYISDVNSDGLLEASAFDGLETAIETAANPNLEVVFLYLENLPANAFDVNSGTNGNKSKPFAVYLPEVQAISASAFYYCSGLTYLSAPKATVLSDSALRQCSGLTDFELSNVTELATNSLNNVTMSSFDFPNVTTLSGGTVFNGCANITSITLGNGDDCLGVTFIHQNAFSSISGSETEAITLTIREGVNSSSAYSINDKVLSAKGIGSTYSDYTFDDIIIDEIEYEVDETEYYLANIDASNYPGGLYWYIANESATVDTYGTPSSGHATYGQNNFDGLIAAIAAANAKNIKPTVIFTELLELPAYSFYYKTDVEFSVTLDKATTIGHSAFYNCTKLLSISGNAVTSIQASAFRQCTGVTSVTLPELTTSSGNGFRKMTSLKTISLPKLTTVGSDEFNISTALESVELASLTTIGHGMFEGCTGLKSVKLPKAKTFASTTELSDAFASCANLEVVYLGTSGTGVTSMQKDTFDATNSSCTLYIRVGEGSIAIDGNDLKIDGTTTISFSKIEEVVLNPTNFSGTLAELVAYDGAYNIDEMGYEWTITDTTLGESTRGDYYNDDVYTLLESVTAANSDGVTPKLIFTNLVTLPENVFYIGVTSGSSNQEFSVQLDVATTIGAGAFWVCKKVTAITANSVKYVGASAFRGMAAIESISLPELISSADGKTALAGQTFRGSASISTISIPKVTEMGANEFNGCTGLTSLSVGTSGFKTFNTTTLASTPVESIALTIGDPLTDANFSILRNVLTVTSVDPYTFKSINGDDGSN